MSRTETIGLAVISAVGLIAAAVAVWCWWRWEPAILGVGIALVLLGTSKW